VGLDGSLFKKEQGGHTFSPEPHGAATACSPIPGVRVPGSTHQTFQHCTAIVARACRARHPPLLHVTRLRAMSACHKRTSEAARFASQAWAHSKIATKVEAKGLVNAGRLHQAEVMEKIPSLTSND
jgi:hypothetical protein